MRRYTKMMLTAKLLLTMPGCGWGLSMRNMPHADMAIQTRADLPGSPSAGHLLPADRVQSTRPDCGESGAGESAEGLGWRSIAGGVPAFP